MDGLEQRPRLRALCLAHRVDILKLARASNMHPLLVWDALIGVRATRGTMHMILCALNELAGTQYTLDDIQASYVDEERYRYE